MPELEDYIGEPLVIIEPPVISEQERSNIINRTEDILEPLRPLIRDEDVAEARRLARECELATVTQYLIDNVPYLKERMGGRMRMASMESTSDEDKMEQIKRLLTERAESMVPDYEMPPPFLGNEVEEARSKQEDASTRYSTQYGQVPFVKPVFRGRSAVDNPYYESPVQRKVYRHPKVTRIKFL